uniref:Uncharacterized protein n=1 Tax=Romanomermis culicivorax TaxID=13658 RepID=A0A915HT08_ROMCU
MFFSEAISTDAANATVQRRHFCDAVSALVSSASGRFGTSECGANHFGAVYFRAQNYKVSYEKTK